MAQILWKGGIEPPDAVVAKDKSQSIATYTGSIEETAEVDEAERPEEQKPEAKSESNRGQMTSDRLGEMLARAGGHLAQQMQQAQRPVEQLARQVKEGGNTNKQQSQASQLVRPRNAAARSVSSVGVYSLAKRRQALGMNDAEQPLIITGGSQRLPVLMPLVATGSAALVVKVSEPEPERKEAQIIPLRFPLSEEQRRSEEFRREAGMSLKEFRELVAPGWTVAELISPRENTRRVKLGICNLWYDTEMAALKIKHAVRDFLYKKRPLLEESAPEVT